jgi:photosystem II stability/assembly factor-like uncharacterized protein
MKIDVSRFVTVVVSVVCSLLISGFLFSPAMAEDVAVEEVVAEEIVAQKSATAVKVLQKSPITQSVATQIMHKALVQDVVRVGEKIFLAGERGHIGWSDDNGTTWTQSKVPTIQDINALYFVTADIGWAVGHDSNIFNTIDAGKTWSMQLDGLAYNLIRAQAQHDQYAEQLEAKQAALDEAQAQLEEAEAAAKPKQKLIDQLQEQVDVLDEEVYELDFQVRDSEKILHEENAPWPLMDVWFSDANNGYAVGAFNAFLMTQDGGKTWTDVSGRLDNPDGLHLNVVSGIDNTVFILGEAGLVFRSTDSGATWESLESPDDGSFFAMHLAKQADTTDLDVLIIGLEGAVFRSSNNGDDWDAVEHSLNYNLNSIFVGDAGLLLIVGNDGAVLRSTDGGLTLEAYRQQNQVTLSSVTVAANGHYIFAGAGGIQVIKPDALVHHD